MSSEANKAKIFSAIEHDGTTWQVGSPVPKDNSTIIRKMLFVDGVVEIYAEPNAGTELAKMGAGLHFMLMPLGIKLVASVPPRAVWLKMMEDTEESLEFEDDEDEDEEDGFEDESDPEPLQVQQQPPAPPPQSYVPVVPVQVAPPVQTSPNGASEG